MTMTVSKEKTKEALVNGSDLKDQAEQRPPSYQNEEQQLYIALPKLNLGQPKDVDSILTMKTVTRDHCVAHLKFLAVLADLRDFISNQDGLFGLFDSHADKFADQSAQARARIREKRWAVYVARAADRYEKWWFAALPQSRPFATMTDQESANYEGIIDCEMMILWDANNLPPIGEE